MTDLSYFVTSSHSSFRRNVVDIRESFKCTFINRDANKNHNLGMYMKQFYNRFVNFLSRKLKKINGYQPSDFKIYKY